MTNWPDSDFVDVRITLELEGTERQPSVTFSDYKGEITALIEKHRLMAIVVRCDKRAHEPEITQRWSR